MRKHKNQIFLSPKFHVLLIQFLIILIWVPSNHSEKVEIVFNIFYEKKE